LEFGAIDEPPQRPTPGTKRSDFPSSGSIALLSKPTPPNDDELGRPTKDMFDSTQPYLSMEHSLGVLQGTVELGQDESSCSSSKNWARIISAYQTCRATPETPQEIKGAHEPFRTQARVRHASTALNTPRVLADSIRIMVAQSEKVNGQYLDSDVRERLLEAVEGVFPCIRPVALTPDCNSECPDREKTCLFVSASVAPVAKMVRDDILESSELPLDSPRLSHQGSIPSPFQEISTVPKDPRLASRPPGWQSSSARNAVDSVGAGLLRTQPTSPSAPPQPPIQFTIATCSNLEPLERPDIGLDIGNLPKSNGNVSGFSKKEARQHDVLAVLIVTAHEDINHYWG